MSEFIEKVFAKKSLEPNLAIEIEVDEEYYKGTYKSILHDYSTEKNLANIGIPIYKGGLIKLPIGINIKVRVYSNTSVFLFKSKIFKMGKEGNIRYLTIFVPDIIFKIQRRKYVRVPLVESGYYYLFEEYEKEKKPKKNRFLTKDFSAGGISMISSQTLNEKDRLYINIDLKDDLKIENQLSQVIRLIGKTDLNEYIYGVEFMNLDNKTESEYVKFVFRYQINSMKKNKRI
ncbi:flagellar brake domain-containing protein [Oceanotoga sp. DSM 15011]|jgi:c-di-GMP-binding flagellar brake protein YcgR|uniref:C-di-GMP-binding flagellar brake protein YcgR n=1 Tax=Oceanotoga teriensis TaxID=515440 RepID=A0AA45C5F0_9BACT|nr:MULTISPECIES: flagellar brake domain-containing protein [Oceanotoga]MDN5342277.1 hypothetical protein [Oceanotoga sp.]MDO7977339.1 flagellar brake domain-containing protein [Oceanotoga teriensis]PWJ88730.1 c-di-GMP-binding flagellar brake protein YcgR [Oceanotoga teriensis]UYP00442.1 flagellar brake domain-containing protein [Oceanotoga sp. DSM 15011]